MIETGSLLVVGVLLIFKCECDWVANVDTRKLSETGCLRVSFDRFSSLFSLPFPLLSLSSHFYYFIKLNFKMDANTMENDKELSTSTEDGVMVDEANTTETGTREPVPKQKKKSHSQAYYDRRKTQEYKDQRQERRRLREAGVEVVSGSFQLSLQLS